MRMVNSMKTTLQRKKQEGKYMNLTDGIMKKRTEQKKEQAQKKPAPTRVAKVTDTFKTTIKAYLDKRAAEDELFAKTYAKENKSLDECCNYILQQVQKSGCHGFADEDIFGMAVHYYDEDDIKNVKPVSAGKIVVNHVVELSEAEKAAAKEKAKADFEKEQLAKMKEEERKREEKERKRKEERIRKAQEAAEREKSMQLSLFEM